jgi:hypothetical protein
MQLTGPDLFFWVAGLAGHTALLGVLLLRRRLRQFPFFTGLIAANVIRTTILYFVLRGGRRETYFYTYWTFAMLDVALELCVLYEIASHVFRPLGYWARDARRSSILLLAGSLLAAAGLTWLASPRTLFWQQTVVIRGALFSSALMSEIFVGTVVLSVSIGLPWKTHVMQIAQGFGVYSIIEIVIEGISSLQGVAHGTAIYSDLSHVRMAVYLVVLVYWGVGLWKDEPSLAPIPAELQTRLIALQLRTSLELASLRVGRRKR